MSPPPCFRRLAEKALRLCPAQSVALGRAWHGIEARLGSPALNHLVDNLSLAYPELTQTLLKDLARRCLVDIRAEEWRQYRLQLLNRNALIREARAVDFRGTEHLDTCLRDGRPLIFATAHYGAFMLGALKVALSMPERRLNFFYNPPARNVYASTSDALLARVSEHCGILHNTPGGVLGALKALRRGESLCIVGDQIVPEGELIFVPFFRRFHGAMQGIAFFAARSDARILPSFARTTGNGSTVLEFLNPIDPMDQKGGSKETRLYRTTASFFASFELQLRRHPTHWRYWGQFRKSSLDFPLPPDSSENLQEQLAKLRRILGHDAALSQRSFLWESIDGAFKHNVFK